MSLPTTQNVPQNFDAFGRWFSQIFQAFSANIGVWLGQGAISGLVSMVVIIIPIALMAPGLFLLIKSGHQPSPAAMVGMIGSFIGAYIVAIVLSLVVGSYFAAGISRTAIKQLRGEPISVGDLFQGGDVVLPLIGANLLAGICIGISFMFCIVPALFVAPLFLLMVPIIVDRREGSTRGISLSFETVKKNYWLFFVYVLVFGVVYFVAAIILGLIPYIGSLLLMIVVPSIIALFTAVPYTEIFYNQTPQAGPQSFIPQAYIPPPVSSPSDAPQAPPPDEANQL